MQGDRNKTFHSVLYYVIFKPYEWGVNEKIILKKRDWHIVISQRAVSCQQKQYHRVTPNILISKKKFANFQRKIMSCLHKINEFSPSKSTCLLNVDWYI